MKIKKSCTVEYRVKKITLGNGEHYFQVEWRELKWWKVKWNIHDFKLETMEKALEVIANSSKTDDKDYKAKVELVEL